MPSGTAKVRNNDSTFEFRPGSDLAWLTTCYEEDAVLVAGQEATTLYPRPRASRETERPASAA